MGATAGAPAIPVVPPGPPTSTASVPAEPPTDGFELVPPVGREAKPAVPADPPAPVGFVPPVAALGGHVYVSAQLSKFFPQPSAATAAKMRVTKATRFLSWIFMLGTPKFTRMPLPRPLHDHNPRFFYIVDLLDNGHPCIEIWPPSCLIFGVGTFLVPHGPGARGRCRPRGRSI